MSVFTWCLIVGDDVVVVFRVLTSTLPSGWFVRLRCIGWYVVDVWFRGEKAFLCRGKCFGKA